MDKREVDPADWTWPSAELVEVTEVTFTDTETGESLEFDADGHATTNEVILAWDGSGLFRLEP